MNQTPAPAELVLRDVCERIVRDAMPATDSGATCFVPRYQIDQLRTALAASLAAHGRVEVTKEMVRRACDAYESTPDAMYYKDQYEAMRNALTAALEKTP